MLRALQDKLMRPNFFEEFCSEFTKELNRLRLAQGAEIVSAKRELVRLEARRKKIVESIIEGVRGRDVKDELIAVGNRKDELEAQLKIADEPPPLLHPRMADIYRTKVAELAAALQRPDTRIEASETLRGLIDAIVLSPEAGQLRIELRGNLAAMLTAAKQAKRSPETGDLLMPVKLVAGACCRRCRPPCAWSRHDAHTLPDVASDHTFVSTECDITCSTYNTCQAGAAHDHD